MIMILVGGADAAMRFSYFGRGIQTQDHFTTKNCGFVRGILRAIAPPSRQVFGRHGAGGSFGLPDDFKERSGFAIQ